MFGKFQFARLSTLFQNVSKDGTQASRALDLAGSSIEELAVLSEREMKKIEDSVGVKFQAAVEKFKQDIMPLGKVFLEAVTPIVEFFGKIFEKFNGLGDNTKKVIAIIVGAVAGLGPILLMTFGLLANGVANIIKFFAMLRGGIAKLNGQTSMLGAGFTYMTQEQIESAAASQQLHQTHTKLIEVFNVEKASVNALASSYNSLSTQMRTMAAQNPSLFAGGAPGAARAVRGLPPTRKYKDGVLSVPGPKGAGDVVPAMLSPGEAVIPTDTTNKYRGLISAMFQDKVPGFMAGRLPGGPGRGIPLSDGPAAVRKAQQAKYRRRDDARQGYNEPHPEAPKGPVFVGMPKSSDKTSQSRQIVEKISEQVALGRFGTLPPSNFGTLLQPFSGRSFPVPGVGGIYRKPNGKIVVVKPTIDEKTALAEVRATQIAREVHGLVAPKQSIRTMIDPTDPSGQRKFIVIESPYDPRIAQMDGKFSKSDMVKQLVASTLRGDKDLQQPNLSGNVLADVGTAGVFDRASGFRDFSKSMPSMEEQAVVNLLGVKGGAKKFFAQETSSLAASMTPAQYDAAIKGEISRSVPRLERLIKSWSGDLGPEEQIVYNNMLKRLKAGAKTDWDKLQPVHARAGEGVKKAIEGIDPGASNSVLEEQLKKYALPSDNDSQLKKAELVRKVESDFVKTLDSIDPNRAKIIKAAWNGGVVPIPPSGRDKRFDAKQTKFMNEIQSMTPITVDGVTKYLHADDMDSFMSDPDGRAKHARTREQVVNNLLYRMGAVPNADGIFVDKGGFEGSRYGSLSAFKTDLRSSNKGAGGGTGRLSKTVRPIAANLKDEYLRRMGDPLKTKAAIEMRSLGLSDAKIIEKLRPELSHIVGNTGIGGRDPLKFLTGTGQYDSFGLNRYIGDGSSRFKDILNWNNKGGANPLGLDRTILSEYSRAADFMATGRHPETPEQRALVARAAELEARAADHKANGGKMPGVKLPRNAGVNAKALLAILRDTDIQPSRIMNLAAQSAGDVLVNPGNETKVTVNPKTGKVKKERLTSANTTPKPAGAVPTSRSQRDSAATSLSSNETVVTRRQLANFRRGFSSMPGFSMPGMIKGDPRFERGVSNPTVRQGEIASQMRSAGYSQEEIDKTIRKIQKREIEAKQSTAAAAGKEAKAQQEQAAISKKQTDAARKRFLENQRRAELNRQMAINFDAAEKEDRQRTLKANKQKQTQAIKQRRMERQQKIGIGSGGASMALGTAGMGLMMAGQQGAGMAAMGASAVAGMAPMLAGMGPIGWITTAAVTIGGGLFLLNKNLENAAKKQAQYVDSVSATTAKMDEVGQITQRVGASRAMDEVRKRGSFGAYNDVERAGTGFGDTFLTSEVGKQMSKSFTDQMKSSGSEIAAKDFALQLSSYVSDGVLDATQAADIADQIGIQLGSRKYTAEILGNLRSVIGPGGEDLARNPLNVRMQIVEETNKRSDRVINSGNIGRAESAQLAALGVNNIAIAKAQADATEFQYRKQIQLLEKEIESTTNAERLLQIKEKLATLESNMASDVAVTNKAYANQIDKEMKRFKNNAQSAGEFSAGVLGSTANDRKEDAYFDSLKAKVKDTLKATGFENIGGETLKTLSRLSDKSQFAKSGFKNQETAQDFEVNMSLLLADKTLNPEQLNSFMAMFAGKLPDLQQALSIGIKTQGAAGTVEMLDYFSTFEDGDEAVKISAQILKSNPKQFNEIGEAMAVLRMLDGHEVNMEAFITTVGYPGLLALSQDLAKVEAMPDKLDKELILKYFTTGNGAGVAGASKENLEILFAQWKDFDKLPDKAQKEAISKFTTIYATIFEDEEARRKYAQEQGDLAARESGFRGRTAGSIKKKRIDEIMSGTLTQAQAAEAARKTKIVIGENGELVTNTGGPSDSSSTGGKKDNPLAFLDQLGVRLKNVRDNAFNALKPVESLLAAFRDKKTQTNAFKLFDGIQNRLLRMGVGQDMRNAVASMSAEDFAKVAALKGDDALFTFEKGKPRSKDTISGLTETGKAADQGYREANLGEFNLVNEETVKNIQDQDKAYRILIGSGLTAAQALEVVSDQGQAAAIAAGAISTSDPEWKTYIANIKTANTELERQEVLNKAIRANEDFKMYSEMPKLVSQMKDLGYSTDQIEAVLGDPQLAKFLVEDLKDGKLDAKEIAEYLNSIEARKIIDIQVKLNQGDLAGAAAEGRDIVDELFAAQEGLIRTGPEAMQLKANERQIRDLEGQIAPFQRRIEELNDQIEDGQRAIEENYTRPIEDLNEEVNDLNRELEMNPLFGDRAIKKIQDENNMLSNDLEIINHAAEEVNKKYDEQAEALSKVEEINQNILEQQKQQLGLADALTQGDISAAAQAAQDIRSTSASQFASGQSDALEQARKNAIGSLVGPQSGLTAEQISEKQFQNSQRIYQMETDPRRLEILNQIQIKQDAIYNLEEKREAALRKIRDLEDEIWKIEEYSIEPLQERIDALTYTNRLLQDSIDKQIEGLKVLGKTRDEWDRINAMLDLDAAVKRAAAGSADLAALLSAAEELNMTWSEILAKLAEYTSGIPGSVKTAGNKIGGVGSDAYVAPEDDAESLAAFEEFIEVVETLDATIEAVDAATAALDAAVELGNMYAVRNAGVALAAAEAAQAAAQAAYDATMPALDPNMSGGSGGGMDYQYAAKGGIIKPQYFKMGGFARGTDTVPAMLTPGEFVMSRYAVQSHGIDKMKSINNGSSVGDSVYNYSISVNVKSDANPDEIARVVMTQIKGIDSQKLRGNRF
jgi:hypothetical protein